MAISTVKATINGNEYSLTYNEISAKWEAQLTAPSLSSFNQSGGYYNVSVKVTDTASNQTTVDSSHATLGNSLKLTVKEKVKPTINITSPGSGAYVVSNTPQIKFTLRDDDSGIKISTLALKIDGGSAIGNSATGMICTAATGGYDCTYTPQSALADGSHTFTVDIEDNDGNKATQSSRTFTIDTIPPSLNVTSPADNYETNQSTLAVMGTTNDATSSPVTITIKLNDIDQGTVTVDGGGAFTKDVTLEEGNNTITVTATDKAGKYTTITRTVLLNTGAPVITSVELIPNPVDAGQTYIIKVTVQ